MGGPGSGAKPRAYPADVVADVVSRYAAGQTIREIQGALPTGYKAQRIVERHVPLRRPAAKRDQRGPANHAWRGDAAGYSALHLRVRSARGEPDLCEWCGAAAREWANLTGAYTDVLDYAALCTSCHRTYDAHRRALTGRRTMPLEVMPHV